MGRVIHGDESEAEPDSHGGRGRRGICTYCGVSYTRGADLRECMTQCAESGGGYRLVD